MPSNHGNTQEVRRWNFISRFLVPKKSDRHEQKIRFLWILWLNWPALVLSKWWRNWCMCRNPFIIIRHAFVLVFLHFTSLWMSTIFVFPPWVELLTNSLYFIVFISRSKLLRRWTTWPEPRGCWSCRRRKTLESVKSHSLKCAFRRG